MRIPTGCSSQADHLEGLRAATLPTGALLVVKLVAGLLADTGAGRANGVAEEVGGLLIPGSFSVLALPAAAVVAAAAGARGTGAGDLAGPLPASSPVFDGLFWNTVGLVVAATGEDADAERRPGDEPAAGVVRTALGLTSMEPEDLDCARPLRPMAGRPVGGPPSRASPDVLLLPTRALPPASAAGTRFLTDIWRISALSSLASSGVKPGYSPSSSSFFLSSVS
mmetsp:Transcript_9565/g.20371  ORF Transcript_9565/g.20371 Transcript_9565/m.20371 type:complete len:224 (-) Transcript_9565:2189-2860(-)